MHKNFRKFWLKFCCQRSKPRLEAGKFSTIVLGGTAALHAYRVWGAVIFWRTNVHRFLLALARDLALARLRLNTSAQRRTSNVEFSKPASRRVANRVDACGADH